LFVQGPGGVLGKGRLIYTTEESDGLIQVFKIYIKRTLYLEYKNVAGSFIGLIVCTH
jgi:hypothetical protein